MGLEDRMQVELSRLVPSNVAVNVIAPADRKYAVWRGAAVLADYASFDQWVTKADYDEHGASIMHKKCYF